MDRSRLIPLIIASALFMENLDSTVIATALPAIARALQANPLHLSLAITAYLFALAVFIPASGWVADRFGARTVFRAGILVFTLGSLACGAAGSLTGFVIARTFQGIGGAMMTPVGRLVLVRSIPKAGLVRAMAWFTVPALIGPLIGPPVGGFITTYFSWRWIFWINLPIGLLGILLVTLFIPDLKEKRPPPFDLKGFFLVGAALLGIVGAFEAIGRDVLPMTATLALGGVGAMLMALYIAYARRAAAPVLDLRLFAVPTYRVALIGGFLFRTGIGAIPFLLPLMLQVGFGLSPFRSGLLTFAAAGGALLMKTAAATILRSVGFRRVLIGNALVAAAGLAAVGLFGPTTPHAVILVVLLAGGFFRSLQFTSINTLAYADLEPARMGRATSLAAVAQQLSLSIGIGTAALLLHLLTSLRGETLPGVTDFSTAFFIVAAIAASSTLVFATLPADAGAELSGHRGPQPASSQSVAASEDPATRRPAPR